MRFLFLLFFYLISLGVFASGDNYHVGARSAGMGNASVALIDQWSIHHNQAGMAFLEKSYGAVAVETLFGIPENSIKGLAVGLHTKSGVFGLNVSSYGFSLYNETKVGLAYARKLGDNFAIGVQMDYLTVGLGENYGRAHAFAAEVGLMAKLNDKLTAGAHIYNPNRAKMADYNNEKIPTIIRLGFDYVFSKKLLVDVEVLKDIDHKSVFKSGLEYHIVDMLYLRTGIATNPFVSSFGFGLSLKNLNIDIATSYHAVLGYTPHISLGYKF
jgi:hypothetical protein